MGKTSIEWTDFSVNPIRARLGMGDGHYCEKISPGCKNCYASRLQPRFRMPQFQEQRSNDDIVHYLDAGKLKQVLRRKKPTRYFWCDMSDMFGEWVPDEWIAACFGVMAATPHHTHQVLTKRPERAAEWFEWLDEQAKGAGTRYPGEDLSGLLDGVLFEAALQHVDMPSKRIVLTWPLKNVQLGTSVEDQPRADERIPLLLQCHAAVRFLNVEPSLGRVNLRLGAVAPVHPTFTTMLRYRRDDIHWVIIGGESGQRARPCALEWIEDIVAQCKTAGVAVFVKQLGAYVVSEHRAFDTLKEAKADGFESRWLWRAGLKSRKGGDMAEWPDALQVREFPGESTPVVAVIDDDDARSPF